MHTVHEDSSPSIDGLELPLWSREPEGWRRELGRSRILIIDDQLHSRSRLFDVAENEEPTPSERLLRRWLNADLVFLAMPRDFRWTTSDAVPFGTFDQAWFEAALAEVLRDPTPITMVFLDLLFGAQSRIEDSSGAKILRWLRQKLPDVPVVLLSNVEDSSATARAVKAGSIYGELSFEDYLSKRHPVDRRPLIERMIEKTAEWADLADPDICAYSAAMRRLARDMRSVVLHEARIPYEEVHAGSMPRPVVIEGEFGSGKNFIANRLVAASRRRRAPFLTLNFGNVDAESITKVLFGVGMYTDAPTCHVVRKSDGGVLRELPAESARREAASGEVVRLASLGLLHRAHIGDQAFGPGSRPLRGSVLLDEIGRASNDMQSRLLGVLNSGRFSPHWMSIELPAADRLDVWFLITLGPETRDALREDLAQRIARGRRFRLPDLRQRTRDIVPLAISRLAGPGARDVHEVLTPGAIQWLEHHTFGRQARDLVSILDQLPSITARLPYSEHDLERTRTSKNSIPLSAAAMPEQQRLTGPIPGEGETILAEAAKRILSHLELCIRISQQASPAGRGPSPTDVHRLFYGMDPDDASTAQSTLGALFRIHRETTRAWIRSSPILRDLAESMSRRVTHLKALLEADEQVGIRK